MIKTLQNRHAVDPDTFVSS